MIVQHILIAQNIKPTQKPQSQWKPTTEQVETLYETLDSNRLIQDKEYNILSSLCKDLRKLQND